MNNESALCHFVETIPGQLWMCPVCQYEARTNALPKMVCGSAANKSKAAGKARPPKPKRAVTLRDPEAHERQLQEAVGQCEHRGAVIESKRTCELCGAKGELYDLYACEIHGQCSLGRRKNTLQQCLGCPDNTNNPDR